MANVAFPSAPVVGGYARKPTRNVAVRPPGPTDDSLAGYSVGDFWVTAKLCFICVANAVGNAFWQPYTAALMPIQSAVGGAAPLFIGGAFRMNPAYTGALFQVGRSQDASVLDIPQLQDWTPDWRLMENFAQGGTLQLAKVYNQDSSAKDLVQATQANRPILTRRNMMGGGYTFVLDSVRNGTLTNKNLVIDSTLAGTTIAVSAFILARCFNAVSQHNFFSLTGTSAARSMTCGYSSALNQFRTTVTGTGLTPLSGKPSNTNLFVGMVSSGSDHTLFVDRQNLPRGSTLGSTAWNGGFVGYAVDDPTGNGYFEFNAFILYGRALTTLERTNLQASLYFWSQVRPQARDTVTFYGDSITESYGGSFGQTLGRQALEATTDLHIKGYECGAFGQTAEALAVQATMTSYLTPIVGQGNNNQLHILCGTNSLNAGTPGVTVLASLKTIVAQARAMGFQKITVGTTLPRGSFTAAMETERLDLNARLRASWSSFADGLVDYASDSIMGAASAPADGTLFLDGIHPVDKGYTGMAQMASHVVSQMWI